MKKNNVIKKLKWPFYGILILIAGGIITTIFLYWFFIPYTIQKKLPAEIKLQGVQAILPSGIKISQIFWQPKKCNQPVLVASNYSAYLERWDALPLKNEIEHVNLNLNPFIKLPCYHSAFTFFQQNPSKYLTSKSEFFIHDFNLVFKKLHAKGKAKIMLVRDKKSARQNLRTKNSLITFGLAKQANDMDIKVNGKVTSLSNFLQSIQIRTNSIREAAGTFDFDMKKKDDILSLFLKITFRKLKLNQPKKLLADKIQRTIDKLCHSKNGMILYIRLQDKTNTSFSNWLLKIKHSMEAKITARVQKEIQNSFFNLLPIPHLF
ncbi:MAG: hypothetical protein D6767_11190 [Candidatus Hydrogenedentota bacterium]|nr:MAG: hypothetical protein D6767_11190 [Candidatus Hydrogenedentota bacterium]